ncbi:MAG: hypothetical protein VX740_05010 [Pseudomonadota bacterium]|nr:hypothetical protein [Pseudomonadota bacterium]MEC9235603.1 hypothetical protein [Pseudomonadota bacterium]MED5422782.1 hypothetical protein [Pseudomonadota bacterium]
MASIFKKIFDKGAKRPESLPEGFVEKFKAFRDAITQASKDVPERWNKHSPYICGYGLPHNSEVKKWVLSETNSVHIRYYDLDMGKNSGLAVIELDRVNECYRLQKAKSYDVPEEAIADFIDMLSLYAEPVFMRALYNAIDESKVLNLPVESYEAPVEEAQVKATTEHMLIVK